MGKIRVHELAHKLGLDNKDVVQRLQAAGISVKSHSSSVYEEEALAVLEKVKTQEVAAPAVRRPGMMIVRKRRDEESAQDGGAEANTPEASQAAAPSNHEREAAPHVDVTPVQGDDTGHARGSDAMGSSQHESAQARWPESVGTPDVGHAAEARHGASELASESREATPASPRSIMEEPVAHAAPLADFANTAESHAIAATSTETREAAHAQPHVEQVAVTQVHDEKSAPSHTARIQEPSRTPGAGATGGYAGKAPSVSGNVRTEQQGQGSGYGQQQRPGAPHQGDTRRVGQVEVRERPRPASSAPSQDMGANRDRRGDTRGGPREHGMGGNPQGGPRDNHYAGSNAPQGTGYNNQQRGGPRPQHTGAPGQAGQQGNAPQGQQAQGPQGQGQAPGVNRTPAAPPKTATVVRMIDREKLMERLPSRRTGYSSGGPGGPNRGGPDRGGPRPGGPGGPGGPGAGGDAQRFGRVTELKVVNDPFGRGREMITVGRDKKAKGPMGGPGAGAGGPGGMRGAPGGPGGLSAEMAGKAGKKGGGRAPSKREMIEMRERSSHPSRIKRKKTGKNVIRKTELTQPKASKRVIKMKETIVVTDFAHQLGAKASDVIRTLMTTLNMMVTQNQSIDFDTAQLVAAEFGYTVDSVAFEGEAVLQAAKDTADKPEELVTRPPVVTVMGHVDHGKTSLLDAIRKTQVASGEAGGITQHIGAYSVPVPGKGEVTFLDTPGHAAFTNMRARGAKVTDLVVLVVAADDGVMPQTEEAIRHAQAAGVPIIVAVNKIDKPEANPDRVMQELTKFQLLSEAWGGETMFVNTSATKGTGIQELLESILLQAEVLDLKANPNRKATAIVIEAELDKGRGPVATVLVQNGTLRQGDPVVVGDFAGKVRAMMDHTGKLVTEAGPSHPVEITGLDGVPQAGDALAAVEDADMAREVAEHRQALRRVTEQAPGAKMSLDDLMKRMMPGGEQLELKIVLKGDVQGSVEAVKSALIKLSGDEVKVNVIYDGVGGISESDVMLAAASNGLVVGFNVRPDSKSRTIAEHEKVEIRAYTIIYDLLDDVRKAMEGLLAPETREKIIGRADVREVFKVSKVGTIAGCRVLEGKAMRNARVRLLRDNVQMFDGKVSSLKHFKNDVREVESGLECGIGIEGFNDIKQGDAIEFYQIEEFARTLSNNPAGTKQRQRGGSDAHA